MARLFLGSFLAEEAQLALREIAERNKDLANDWRCNIHWIRYDKIHLTWLFFGEVENERQSELSKEILAVIEDNQCKKEISIVYDCLQTWYIEQSPRLIVLTSGSVNADLKVIAAQLRSKLKNFISKNVALKDSGKAFVPHVTIMRLQQLRSVKPALPLNDDADGEESSHRREGAKAIKIDYSKIKGFEKIMPLRHTLNNMALIESAKKGNAYEYSILKKFEM